MRPTVDTSRLLTEKQKAPPAVPTKIGAKKPAPTPVPRESKVPQESLREGHDATSKRDSSKKGKQTEQSKSSQLGGDGGSRAKDPAITKPPRGQTSRSLTNIEYPQPAEATSTTIPRPGTTTRRNVTTKDSELNVISTSAGAAPRLQQPAKRKRAQATPPSNPISADRPIAKKRKTSQAKAEVFVNPFANNGYSYEEPMLEASPKAPSPKQVAPSPISGSSSDVPSKIVKINTAKQGAVSPTSGAGIGSGDSGKAAKTGTSEQGSVSPVSGGGSSSDGLDTTATTATAE